MAGSADIAFVLALVVMGGCSLYFAPRIQVSRMPMQWGFDGRPTWYAPKVVGLWGPLGFALVIRLFVLAAAHYTPDKVHYVNHGIVIFSVVIAAAHAGNLLAATRWISRNQ